MPTNQSMFEDIPTREQILKAYNLLVKGIEVEAENDEDRAYGGVIRAAKGKLVERITNHLVRIAWHDCGGAWERLSFGDQRSYKVNVREEYVSRLPQEIKDYISENINKHFYRIKVDLHVFIDGNLVLGIECKSFTENAMMKRILVDFMLLKHIQPDLKCCLLQLESQLGGDYSNPLASVNFGSPSTHTLMSFFPELDINVITLLEKERKVDKPIHSEEYFKELNPAALNKAIKKLGELLKPSL